MDKSIENHLEGNMTLESCIHLQQGRYLKQKSGLADLAAHKMRDFCRKRIG